MARNRKLQLGAVRLGPALKASLLCVFLGGSAVGYVLQKNQIYDLGRQIREREIQLERLVWENKLWANQLADLQSPNKLSDRVRDQKIDLIMPQPSQVIWLPEPPPEPPTNASPQWVEGKRDRTS